MKPLTQEQFEAIRDFVAGISNLPYILNDFITKFQPQPKQPTLLPFNLEEALKNPDRVVYRDGSKPLEWHFYSKIDNPWSIISVLQNQIMVHRNDGTYHEAIGRESKYDLCLLPEAKKTYFANVYSEHRSLPMVGQTYNTEQTAINIGKESKDYLKTISFTI